MISNLVPQSNQAVQLKESLCFAGLHPWMPNTTSNARAEGVGNR